MPADEVLTEEAPLHELLVQPEYAASLGGQAVAKVASVAEHDTAAEVVMQAKLETIKKAYEGHEYREDGGEALAVALGMVQHSVHNTSELLSALTDVSPYQVFKTLLTHGFSRTTRTNTALPSDG